MAMILMRCDFQKIRKRVKVSFYLFLMIFSAWAAGYLASQALSPFFDQNTRNDFSFQDILGESSEAEKDSDLQTPRITSDIVEALSKRLKVTPSATNDQDLDGLDDSLEASLGTNASERDSDFDGLLDSVEYYATGTADLDGDGRPSMLDGDSDGDLLPDHLDLSPYSVLLAPRANSIIDFGKAPIVVGRVDLDSEVIGSFQLGANEGPHSTLIYNQIARVFSQDNITRERYLKFITIVEWDSSKGQIKSTGLIPPLGGDLFKAQWKINGSLHRAEFASYFRLTSFKNTFGWGTDVRWGDLQWRTYRLSLPANGQKASYSLTASDGAGLIVVTDAPLYSDAHGIWKPDLRKIPKIFEMFPISTKESVDITISSNLQGAYDFIGTTTVYTALKDAVTLDQPLYVHVFGFSIEGAGEPTLSEPNLLLPPAFTLVDALVDRSVPGGTIVRETASPYALLGMEFKNYHSTIRGFIPYKLFLEEATDAEINDINSFQNSLMSKFFEQGSFSKKNLYQDYLDLLNLMASRASVIGFPGTTGTYNGTSLALKDMIAYNAEQMKDHMKTTFQWTKNVEDITKTVMYVAVRKQLISSINLDTIYDQVIDRAWINVSHEDVPWYYRLEPQPVSSSKLKLFMDATIRFDAVEGTYLKARLENFRFLDAVSSVSAESKSSTASFLAKTDFPVYYRQIAFPDLSSTIEVKEKTLIGAESTLISSYFSVLTNLRLTEDVAASNARYVKELVSVPGYQGYYLLDNVGIGHPRRISRTRSFISTTAAPPHTDPNVVNSGVYGGNGWWKNASYIVGVTDATRMVWAEATLVRIAFLMNTATEFLNEWYATTDVPSDLWSGFQSVLNSISNWQDPYGKISAIMEKIKSFGADALQAIEDSGLLENIDTIREYVRAFRNVFGAFDSVREFLGPLAPALDIFGLLDNAKSAYDSFKQLLSGKGDFWEAVNGIIATISVALDVQGLAETFGLTRLTNLVPKLLGRIMAVLAALDAGMAIGDRITGNNRGGLIGWLRDLWGMLKLGYKEGWGHLWKAYKAALADQWSGIMEDVKDFFNKVGDWIKRLLKLKDKGAKEEVAAEKPDDSLYPIVSTSPAASSPSNLAIDRPYIDTDETFYYLANNFITEYGILPPPPTPFPSAPYVSNDNLGHLLGQYYTLEALPAEELNVALFTTALTLISLIGKAPRLDTSPATILLQSSIPVYLKAEFELLRIKNWINTWVNVSSKIKNVPTSSLQTGVPPWLKEVFDEVPTYENYSVSFNKQVTYLQFLKEFYPGIYNAYLSGEMSLLQTEEEVAKRLDPNSLAYAHYTEYRIMSKFDKFITAYWMDKESDVYEAALMVQRDYVYGADVVILGSGYSKEMFNLLTEHFNVIPRVLPIEQFTADEARGSHGDVLVIPTGALRIDDEETIKFLREQFNQYLYNGGTIIVFPQARTTDYATIPMYDSSNPALVGGGYAWGYNEYRGCLLKSATVNAIDHPITAGFNRSLVDLALDGALVTWPKGAEPVLSRTTGRDDTAALVSFKWGPGRVILTSTYTDFRYGSTKTISNDEKVLLESLFNYALGRQKENMTVIEKGQQQPSITITFQNPFRDSGVWMAKLVVIDPSGAPKTVFWQNLSLFIGESIDVTIPLNISEQAPPGIYTVQVTYYSNDGRTYRDSQALQFALKAHRDEITNVQASYNMTTQTVSVSVTLNLSRSFKGELGVLVANKYYKLLNDVNFKVGSSTLSLTIENVSLIPSVSYRLSVTVYEYTSNRSELRLQSMSTFIAGEESFKLTMQASDTQVSPGTKITFSITVNNTHESYDLRLVQVNFDIIDPSGALIHDQDIQSLNVSAHSSITKLLNWTVPSKAMSGIYQARAFLVLNKTIITSTIINIKVVNGTDVIIKTSSLPRTTYHVGDPITVNAKVAATGNGAINHRLTIVIFKGSSIISQVDSNKFNLTYNEELTLQVSIQAPDTPGNYSVVIQLKNAANQVVDSQKVGDIEVLIKIQILAFNQDSNIVIVGSPSSFTVTLKNTYFGTVQVKVELFSNDQLDVGQSTTITLASGETKNVTLSITIQGTDRTSVKVQVTDQSSNSISSKSITIAPKAPVEITAYSIVTPQPIYPGTPVTIDVTLQNYLSVDVNYKLNASISAADGFGDEIIDVITAQQQITINLTVMTGSQSGNQIITLTVTDLDNGITGKTIIISIRVTSLNQDGYVDSISLSGSTTVVAGESQTWVVRVFNANQTNDLTFNVTLYYQLPWAPQNLVKVDSVNVTVSAGQQADVLFNVTLPKKDYAYNLTAVLIPPSGISNQDNLTIQTDIALAPIHFTNLAEPDTVITVNNSASFTLTFNNLMDKDYLNVNMTFYGRLNTTSSAWQTLDSKLVNVSASAVGIFLSFNVTFPLNGTWIVMVNCSVVPGIVESINMTVTVWDVRVTGDVVEPIPTWNLTSKFSSSSRGPIILSAADTSELSIVSIAFDKNTYEMGDTVYATIVLTNSGSTSANTTLVFDLPTIYYHVQRDIVLSANSNRTLTISFDLGNGLLSQTYEGMVYLFSETTRVDAEAFSIDVISYALDTKLTLNSSVFGANDTMKVSIFLNNTGSLDIIEGQLSVNIQVPGVSDTISLTTRITLQKGYSDTYNFTTTLPSYLLSGQGVISYTVTVDGIVVILAHDYVSYEGVEPVSVNAVFTKTHLDSGDDLSGTINLKNNQQGSVTVNVTLVVRGIDDSYERTLLQLAAKSATTLNFLIDLPNEMPQGVYEAILTVRESNSSQYFATLILRFTMKGPNIVEDQFGLNATTLNAGNALMVNVTLRNAGSIDVNGTMVIQLFDESGQQVNATETSILLNSGNAIQVSSMVFVPTNAYDGIYKVTYAFQSASSNAILLRNEKLITINGLSRTPSVDVSLSTVNETLIGERITTVVKVINTEAYTASNLTVTISTNTSGTITTLYVISIASIQAYRSYILSRSITIQNELTTVIATVTWNQTQTLARDTSVIHGSDAPPTIGDIYTAEERNYASLPVSIHATVVDNVRTESVTLYYRFSNDESWQSLTMDPDSSRTSWQASIPTSANHQTLYYYLVAQDNAGLTATSENKTVTLYSDGDAPLVTVDLFPTDEIITGVVNITISASDGNGSGINIIMISVEDTTIFNMTQGSFTATKRITHLWDSTEVTDGSQKLLVIVKDRVGNQNTTTFTLDIDNNAPVIPLVENMSIIKEIMGFTQPVLEWKPEDAHPRSFTLTIDGKTVLNEDWDGSPIQYQLTDLDEGVHIFNLTVTDALNRSTSSIVQVTVSSQLLVIGSLGILTVLGIIGIALNIKKRRKTKKVSRPKK